MASVHSDASRPPSRRPRRRRRRPADKQHRLHDHPHAANALAGSNGVPASTSPATDGGTSVTDLADDAQSTVRGVLHLRGDKGDGILRDPDNLLRPLPGEYIVPRQRVQDARLRPGVLISATTRGRVITRVVEVENRPPEQFAATIPLHDATALDPEPMLKLEHDPAELTTRIIDLLTPVGFGQRGLIVAPPRTGKTILMQNIARGIHANHPEAELVLLLIDERPEEVTDMRRNVPGVVYASSNDNTVETHLELSQLVIERCKRRVETGAHVVVLMDSLTRLGRAFNTGGKGGGRTMSGGLDNRALEIPKKLFGAARKLEHGGSLTILATCLIDTGSQMDKVIFEEFKGTGNMELTLDRNLANQRVFPAIDIASSGTRKEEKLLAPKALDAGHKIRRHLLNMSPVQAMKSLMDTLKKHPTNQSLFDTIR